MHVFLFLHTIHAWNREISLNNLIIFIHLLISERTYLKTLTSIRQIWVNEQFHLCLDWFWTDQAALSPRPTCCSNTFRKVSKKPFSVLCLPTKTGARFKLQPPVMFLNLWKRDLKWICQHETILKRRILRLVDMSLYEVTSYWRWKKESNLVGWR